LSKSSVHIDCYGDAVRGIRLLLEQFREYVSGKLFSPMCKECMAIC